MNELFITVKVRVGDLVPNVINPRKIKSEAKRELWIRLEKYGLINSPVMDFDGVLLSGHQCTQQMVDYGFADKIIDVRKAVRKLSDEEAKEVVLIGNYHAGEFDAEKLQKEFADLLDNFDFGIDFDALSKELTSTSLGDQAEAEMPIVPKLSEKYTAFVVVCRNEIDENHIAEKFGVERGSCYKSKHLGMMYVVDAGRLLTSPQPLSGGEGLNTNKTN